MTSSRYVFFTNFNKRQPLKKMVRFITTVTRITAMTAQRLYS